ncbi:hypothetical protein [Mycobacteroides abscessus]|uniref:hypothetical protein n=1 Tax=Mycobacteroides abscessus TaxID=36809 RepID=UPI001F3EFF0E|nr:hypothetical protein [Mycobacteroides abscessus]
MTSVMPACSTPGTVSSAAVVIDLSVISTLECSCCMRRAASAIFALNAPAAASSVTRPSCQFLWDSDRKCLLGSFR